MKNIKIIFKISLIVAILSVVSIGLAYTGYFGLSKYSSATNDIKLAAQRSLLGERVNAMVYSVVMDSRGIYMSRDQDDVAKYGKSLLESLDKMNAALKEWEQILPDNQVDEVVCKIRTVG